MCDRLFLRRRGTFQLPRGRPHPERIGDLPPWKSGKLAECSCIVKRFLMMASVLAVRSLCARLPFFPPRLLAFFLLVFFLLPLAIVFTFLVVS
jgi:hypothetical protein